LSKYNHRAHRETIIFHEINRVSAASLCALSIFILSILSSPLLHYQVTEKLPGNKKNEALGIKELPKIKDKKFLISCLPDIIALRPRRISP
jgi:hypothetical protein